MALPNLNPTRTNAAPTNLKKEAIAGLTTFLTMAYIVAVNPSILSTQGTGMTFSGVLTATVLLCFTMTLLMGLYAKLPIAVGPGMGINSFFTFSLILGEKIPWPTALGMVFWSGVLFIALSVTPLRTKLAQAIPHHLRIASAVGIGIFIALIGLRTSGLIVADPTVFVKMGKLEGLTLISLIGFLVAIPFLIRKSPLAFTYAIVTVTAIAGAFGYAHLPETYLAWPDFRSVFFKLDIWSAFKLSFLPTILSLVFTDLFDSISTFVGVCQSAKMFDENGEPLRLKEGLIVDAFSTFSASLFGTSAGTAYIESAAGVETGGRTGWSSVFTATLFLPCFFLSPILAVIPPHATAPILVIIGALMFRSISDFDFKKIEEMIPAFLTIILIPFTFSITRGMLFGFASHGIIFLLAGRHRELTLTMKVLSVGSLAYLVFS